VILIPPALPVVADLEKDLEVLYKILLHEMECTGFQPFARALQREIDIPVFSWGTLLDYAYAVTVHRDFYGHV